MRPRASRVFGMLIVLASWTGPASLLADTPYAFTDLTGAYTAFFDRTQTLSEPERIGTLLGSAVLEDELSERVRPLGEVGV